MPSTFRKKYKSRREKNKQAAKNTRMLLIGAAMIAVILIFKNRVYIKDYIATYFY